MKSSLNKKIHAFKSLSKPKPSLPKYDGGGGFSGGNYNINMGVPSSGGGYTGPMPGGAGSFSGGSMVSGGIGAISSMIPEGEVYNPQGSVATDQAALDKQNTRTDRLNKSSKGLASAASTAAMIPGVGWIAGAALGLASLGTKLGAKASAKKAGAMETVTYAQDGGAINKQTGLFSPLNIVGTDKAKINPSTTVNIKDNRTTHPVTGKPINPNKDLKSGNYDKDLIYRTIQASKLLGVDPYKSLGVLGQETNFGKANSESPFHLTFNPKGNAYDYVNEEKFSKLTPEQRSNTLNALDGVLGLQEKMNSMTSKGSSADSLQRYNGTGKVGVNTEKEYHNRTGRNTNTFYGIDVAKEGPIDTKKNPVYGKTVLSLAEMLKSNPSIKNMVDTSTINFQDGGSITNLPNNIASFRYENGGDLIKYNLPDHSNGGGTIDANGRLVNPNSELAQAEIEKQEVFDPNQNYIFSDTLKPMKSRLTFADISKKIDSKYKDKTDAIATNSKDRELERLAQSNESMRLAKESKNPFKKQNGGKLKLNQPKPGETYNIDRANQLGYKPDEFGHLPSVDEETGAWLKSKQHPTAFRELMQWQLNPELNKQLKHPVVNPSGYFGNDQLQYDMRETPEMKSGGKLPKYVKGGDMYNPFGIDMNFQDPNLITTQPIGYGQGIVEENPFITNDMGNIKRTENIPGVSSTPTAVNKNPFGLTTGDKMQLGAGALTGITNLAMGLKKPQKFSPITLGDNGMQHIKDVRFNENPILMNRNVAASQINQSVGSNAARIANLQSLYRGTNTQLGELAQKEALANVGQGNRRAQTAFQTSQFNAGAQERSRGLNIQSKATAQNLRAKGLEDIFGSVGDVGKGMNQRQSNNIQLDVLNSLASQYGIDPETLKIYFKQKGITVTK